LQSVTDVFVVFTFYGEVVDVT